MVYFSASSTSISTLSPSLTDPVSVLDYSLLGWLHYWEYRFGSSGESSSCSGGPLAVIRRAVLPALGAINCTGCHSGSQLHRPGAVVVNISLSIAAHCGAMQVLAHNSVASATSVQVALEAFSIWPPQHVTSCFLTTQSS